MKLRDPVHSGRMFRICFLGRFTWLLLLPSSVAAQQIKVTLDPAQTKIEWTLGDVLHTVHGTFKLRTGNVTFDPQSGDASGEIIVDATSGESGNNARDKKMHKEVLESQRYPEIIFSPKHVTGRVADHGTVFSTRAVGRVAFYGASPRKQASSA